MERSALLIRPWSAAAVMLAACAAPPTAATPAAAPLQTPIVSRTLTVFAASSLLDAFSEMGRAFEAAHPGVTVTFNFDGSQTLRTQLEQGAAADVFAAANQKEMAAAAAASLMDIASEKIFASNSLVVVLPPGNPANVSSLADLARPGLMLVLAAPEVPAGAYARAALDKLEVQYGAGYKANVLANVISDEHNVKQALAKVLLGEADAGIVYSTDARAAPDLPTMPIPPEANVVAVYPIAVLKASSQPDIAAAFVAFVLSPEGQAVMQKWGFGSPAP